MAKSPDGSEENTSNEKKPKIAQREKRKTNAEKSLEAVFDKFNQFSNDEFLRCITVTLIRVLYVLKNTVSASLFYLLMILFLIVQVPKTGRREIYEGTRIQGCTKEGREAA